jgi:hypothetical protein
VSCILEKNCPADCVAKEIEPMVVHPQPETSTPVQKQMEAISTPAPTYNEIPIKTGRKPRGPNKPKEPVVEESVFDKPVEVEMVAPVKVITPAVTTPPVKPPTISTPTTPVRVNELAKLIKMWVKASGFAINSVNIDLLKAQAFDIVENDSDETIVAGIGEAKRLMQG